MIFYSNLFKANKFALKVIDMNRPAPNLQLSLGTKYDVGSCIGNLSSAVIAKQSKQNIAKDEYLNLLFDFLALLLGTISYVIIRSQAQYSKLGAGLFISITLRANLKALNKFK